MLNYNVNDLKEHEVCYEYIRLTIKYFEAETYSEQDEIRWDIRYLGNHLICKYDYKPSDFNFLKNRARELA